MFDEFSHDASHSTRSLVAEALDARRAEIAAGIVMDMRKTLEMNVSPLIVRTLVHTLGKSLADGSPDPVTHWSRMVRHAHPAPVVIAMIDHACAAAEATARTFNGDLATIVVFLEIVKARSHAILSDEPAFEVERDTTGHVAIQSLLAVLRARDDATCSHSQATGEWARRIALRLGLPPAITERTVRAGVLHDIGKIRVPDAILFKEGALAAPEWEVMKLHAESGAEILSQIPTLAQYAPIVIGHHERFDGRGYPNGLRGEEICLETRIVSVADSFHAMVSDRPYRRAFSYGEAITILAEGRGTQWDAEVAQAMISLAAEDRNRATDANLSSREQAFYAGCIPIPTLGDSEAV